jgi:superoxide oxidase
MHPHRYDPVSRFFHWSVLSAVIAAYAIGLYREGLPKDDFRAYLMSLHMSVGLLVMGLTVARIGWRSFVSAPPPAATSPVLKLAARAGHLALYVALAAVPLIGLLAAWAKARNVDFFGLFPVPALIAPDKALVKPLEEIHEIAAHAMMILSGLHAAAAIFHQFVLKDGTLSRMSPFPGAREAVAEG